MEILISDPSLVHPSAGMAAGGGSPGVECGDGSSVQWWEQPCFLLEPSQCTLAQSGSKCPGLLDEVAVALGVI